MGTLRETTTVRAKTGEKAAAVEARAARTRLAIAVTGLAIVGLAALGVASQASAARDPSASAFLEGALKPQMQATLKKSVPGIAVTKVTCFVPTTANVIQGKCTARFTVEKYALKGTYKTTAKLDNQSRLTWSTSSVTCSDLRGRRASCTGESNTGNGLISAQLAETQLLTNGFNTPSNGATVKVKSAICQGLKSKKWSRGKFDDVYAQLKCSVKAADGASYSLVLVMVGNDGYNLTNVVKK